MEASAEANGSGWGCGAHGYKDPKVIIDRCFVLTPPRTGFHSMHIIQPYNGFYIARADDGFWTCKNARLKVDGFQQAYQYFWHYRSEFTALDVEGDNIDTYGRLDTGFSSFYGGTFGARDSAFLLVTQRLRCDADGGGSHSEVNFRDGNANVLRPPVVIVFLPPPVIS